MAANAQNIESVYSEIALLESYKPSINVNRLFSTLVTSVLKSAENNVLPQSKAAHLRSMCSDAEYELELYWAKRISESRTPRKELLKFPYIENYTKLTNLEWRALEDCGTHDVHKVLFVGGGPLPLSAIQIAQTYGCAVTVLDIDKDACAHARKVVASLGLQESITVVQVDARTYAEYANYNVVIVAALAGVDSHSKERVLTQVKKNSKPDTHILLRSSWGARELLYPPVDTKWLEGLQKLVEIRPQDDVINSIIIAKS